MSYTRSMKFFCFKTQSNFYHAVIRIALVSSLVVIPKLGFAGSATWKAEPTNSDWNTADNWAPATVPENPGDVATFDVSSITGISIGEQFAYIQLDSIVFNNGASAYKISVGENYIGLVLSGTGIVNNSNVTQNFDSFGSILLSGYASAGNDVVYTNQGRGNPTSYWIGIGDHATAGSATFVNVGNNGALHTATLQFTESATAGDSTIINTAGQAYGGVTLFFDSSTAGNSTITNYQYAYTNFYRLATGGTATLVADAGTLHFQEQSTGGQARVELLDGGILDLGTHVTTSPMTIGSLEGDNGTVRLFQQQLTIGGNGLSTTYGGTITGGGSLLKIGNESLTLSGASIYKGGTIINGGTLLVKATTGSATGTGNVQVNGGTFGGSGNVSGAVTIGNGTSGKAILAPGVKGPGTLTIAKGLTFKSNGNYNFELGLAPRPKADQVAANGVTITSGAKFNLKSKGTATLASATSFTVISNTSANPISGTFSNLADGSTIIAGNNTLRVSYSGGDGNDLTLTVQ